MQNISFSLKAETQNGLGWKGPCRSPGSKPPTVGRDNEIPNFILLDSYCLTYKEVTSFHVHLVSPFPLRNSVNLQIKDLQNYPEVRVSCCRSLSFQYLYILYFYILLLLQIALSTSPPWDKVWPTFQEQLEDQEVGTDGFSQSALNQFQSVIFSHTPHAYNPSKK